MGRADERDKRSDYKVFRTITTRWADNDVYGHMNNVVHYSLFDTAINGWLFEAGALDFARVTGLASSWKRAADILPKWVSRTLLRLVFELGGLAIPRFVMRSGFSAMMSGRSQHRAFLCMSM